MFQKMHTAPLDSGWVGNNPRMLLSGYQIIGRFISLKETFGDHWTKTTEVESKVWFMFHMICYKETNAAATPSSTGKYTYYV